MMESGALLKDEATGLKLMVVESPSNNGGFCVSVDGRPLQQDPIVPGGQVCSGMSVTTDPGIRGK